MANAEHPSSPEAAPEAEPLTYFVEGVAGVDSGPGRGPDIPAGLKVGDRIGLRVQVVGPEAELAGMGLAPDQTGVVPLELTKVEPYEQAGINLVHIEGSNTYGGLTVDIGPGNLGMAKAGRLHTIQKGESWA